MKLLIRYFAKPFLGLINRCVSIENNSILFIPHENCRTDNYDIINYSADNALCLFNDIIQDKCFNEFKLSIIIDNSDNKQKYSQYLRSKGYCRNVTFIERNKRLEVIKAFMRSKICITCHPHYDFSYLKMKSQTTISLGYFTPFKNDYYVIKGLSQRQRNKSAHIINKSFDYHITTSDISSRIISSDTLLNLEKFMPLGMPRNDLFYRNEYGLMNKLEEALGIKICNIILYTPTYRDYEVLRSNLGDQSLITRKSILGPISREEWAELDTILQSTNSILVAKLHPLQEKNVFYTFKSARVIPYSYLQQLLVLSLYDVMHISKLLITDYTSTSFDYMHLNRPIIYYFYDYEQYRKNRGFSLNPIESVCGGEIVFDFKDLLKSIKNNLKKDLFVDKRAFVNQLYNFYRDGNCCQRIKKFILELN